MKTVADPTSLSQLLERLDALRPDAPRKWGTLTPGEMLCHLADATDSVLDQSSSETVRPHPILKLIALRLPLAWPRGLPTPAAVDPKEAGTKPGDFEADRRRTIAGLRRLAAAPDGSLTSSHGAFGPMTPGDWRRWAYRHADHHLRQFGL